MEFYLLTTSRTYNVETKQLVIGGVQSYSRELCLLAQAKGYKTIMYQFDTAQKNAHTSIDGIEFHLVNKARKSNQQLFKQIYKENNSPSALFVIASDQMDIKTKAKNVIVINHGIAFDGLKTSGILGKNHILQHVDKLIRCIKNVKRVYWNQNTVGVDYNYFNWFRTLGVIYPGKKFCVIPNYSSDSISKDIFSHKMSSLFERDTLHILFARRFVRYRGTIIFANCIDRLLKLFNNLDFTFAGEGQLKDILEKRYAGVPNVHITKYEAKDSVGFHSKYDIAVVPTICSEGTSLSLLEAMSAGCFPIATHVGGMTNIILDHYNGLLCYPDEDSVFKALYEAVTMKKESFIRIATNAYRSSVEAFSVGSWSDRWSCFIDDVMSNYRSALKT